MRVLLVECATPRPLLYLARELRKQHPQWRLELLRGGSAAPKVEAAAGLFDRCWALTEIPADREWDLVLFPLLSRGFVQIKLAAWRIPAKQRKSIDFSGRLRDCDLRRLLTSVLRPPYAPGDEFVKGEVDEAAGQLRGRVLLVKSASDETVERTRPRWSRRLDPQAEVQVLERGSLFSQWRILRRERFSGALLFVDGRPGYFRLKLFPWLLGIDAVIAVDEIGATFEVNRSSLARHIFHRIRDGRAPVREGRRILLLQTETPPYMLEAARRIRSPHLYPRAETLLLCSERHYERFSKAGEFSRVLSAPARPSIFELWRIRRMIRAFDPDLICCVYSRRPIFRKAKAYFLLSGFRKKLAFNSALDCFELTIRTAGELGRWEPLLFESHPEEAGCRVAWIHSGTMTECRRALETIRNPDVAIRPALTVLCPQELEEAYAEMEGVEQVLTYQSSQRFSFLQAARKLARENPEVVSALFTRRRKFLPQKLLFLLLPGAARLAFNRHLDCFILRRRKIGKTIRLFLESTPIHLREVQRFLFLETEGPEFCRQLLDSLHHAKIAPKPLITVYCNESRRQLFESRPDVERIVPYYSGFSLQNLLGLKKLLDADVEVVAAALTGRPTFRFQKLLFFLYPVRHRLAFNEHLHCHYLNSSLAGFLLNLRDSPESLPLSLGRAILKGALFLPRFLYLLVWLALAKRKRARGG